MDIFCITALNLVLVVIVLASIGLIIYRKRLHGKRGSPITHEEQDVFSFRQFGKDFIGVFEDFQKFCRFKFVA